MGVGTLQYLADRLIENGAAPQTPVAVVANATLPAQKLVRATLARIAAQCRQHAVEAPAVIIIGPAAQADPRFNWLAASPLFAKTIVVTRDQNGNTEFAKEIAARGGSPVEFATIRIEPLTDKNPFLHALAQFPDYDWIIFTSKNGVRVFFDVLNELRKDIRVFASAKVAAIGPQTANALTLLGLKPDFVPEVFTGRELAGQLARFTNVTGKRILLLRSRNASDELPQLLRREQAVVDDIAIYETIPVSSDAEKLKQDINTNRLHWLTFASPSAADSFFQQLRPELVNSSKAKVASIGPVTSDRLRKLGVNVDVEASQHTTQGLIAAIKQHQL
jgi:uroporphyrinogen III methyltransferase/synthase